MVISSAFRGFTPLSVTLITWGAWRSESPQSSVPEFTASWMEPVVDLVVSWMVSFGVVNVPEQPEVEHVMMESDTAAGSVTVALAPPGSLIVTVTV